MANNMSPELLALLQSGNYTPSNSADWQKPWGGGAQQMGRDDSASGSGWISGMGNAYYDPASNSYFVPQYQVNQTGGEDGTTSLGPLIGYKNFDNSPAIQEQGHINRLYNPDGTFNKTFTSSKYQVDPGEKLTMALIAMMAGGAAYGAMSGAGAAGGGVGGAAGGAGPGSAGWGMDLGMGGLAGDGVAATAVGGAGTAGPGMAGWGADLGMEGLAGTVGTGGVGFTPATGAAGGGGMWETIKSGASSLLPGGGGGGSTWGGLVSTGAQLVGGVLSKNAAEDASAAMIAGGDRAIAENSRQFDTVRQLLAPYMAAGVDSLGAYRRLMGVDGAPAQQGEINALQNGAEFTSLSRQGEDAILQNASATGGLRGGNTQSGLATFRSNLLTGLIDRQLGRYGGLVQLGQNSAAGVGNAAMTTGANNAALINQNGAAQAGGIIAGNNALINTVGGIGGLLAGQQAGAPTAMPTYGGKAF